MNTSSEPETGRESDANRGDAAVSRAEAERTAGRVRFIFRRAGDNLPTRELEKFLMAYRLGTDPV